MHHAFDIFLRSSGSAQTQEAVGKKEDNAAVQRAAQDTVQRAAQQPVQRAAQETVQRAAQAPEQGRVLRLDDAHRQHNLSLEELEQVVKYYLLGRAWIEAGDALSLIEGLGLYRDRAAESFDEYFKQRWGKWALKKREVYYLTTAARVAKNVQGVKHGLSIRAAVALSKLPPEQQAECLRECIAGAKTLRPTAGYVIAAVETRLGQTPKKKPKPTNAKRGGPKTVRLRLPGFSPITIIADGADDPRKLLVYLERALEWVRSKASEPRDETDHQGR